LHSIAASIILAENSSASQTAQ